MSGLNLQSHQIYLLCRTVKVKAITRGSSSKPSITPSKLDKTLMRSYLLFLTTNKPSVEGHPCANQNPKALNLNLTLNDR